MELRTTDLAVLIIYMAGVFGLGCWFARKSGSTQEFMAAGGSLPGWAVGLSIFGTYVSSIGFLGNTGKAYSSNWNSWVFGLSLPIAAVIAVRYFVPLYRKRGEVSAYAQLEHRFGPWARMYALVCFLLSQMARIGTILYLVSLALSPLTGWPVSTIIVVTGLMVTIYTLLGGIEAVIWTDVAQSIVLIGGAVLCAGIVLMEMPEGPGQLFEVANENNKFSLGSFSADPATLLMATPTFWMVLLYGLFINLQNFGISQSFVQRYITAKSDKDAIFSVWLGTLLFPVVSILFFFIGTGLYSLYHTDTSLLDEVRSETAKSELMDSGVAAPTASDVAAQVDKTTAKIAAAAETELLAEGVDVSEPAVAKRTAALWDKEIGDKVLPHFIVRKLPAGLAGLLIAAIFAAAMSSVDTSLNSSATLVLCDIYKRYLKPDAGERDSMKVLYGSTLVFGVGGTLAALALAMMNLKSALDAWWVLEGIFTGGMLGLFLLGLISKRAGNPQAMIAGGLGLLIIMWLALSQTKMWPTALNDWSNPLHSFMTIVVGTSSIVLIGMLAGMFAAPAHASSDPAQQD
ncbi:MAG: sodium:solute symporter [Planctomycetaceae bacterium]|jgi:SSS family solute:Na+ symporter